MECVSKNGNLILNVGPNAKGQIPEEPTEILAQIGKWMSKNSGSIYNCGKSYLQKPEWGYYTQNGDKLFAHVFDNNIGPLPLAELKGKVKRARLPSDNSEIAIVNSWNATEFKDYLFITFGHEEDWWTYPIPDDTDTVVEFDLK